MPTVMVTLSPKHHPTENYVKQLRLNLSKDFPGVTFAFLPSDMVTQILNFGLPAPIDIQVIGNNLEGNRVWASRLHAGDPQRSGCGRPPHSAAV